MQNIIMNFLKILTKNYGIILKANILVRPLLMQIVFLVIFLVTFSIYNTVHAEEYWSHWSQVTHEEIIHRGPDAKARQRILDYVSSDSQVRINTYPYFPKYKPSCSILPWPTLPFQVLPDFFWNGFFIRPVPNVIPDPVTIPIAVLQDLQTLVPEQQAQQIAGRLFDLVNNVTKNHPEYNIREVVYNVIGEDISTQLWYTPHMTVNDPIHDISKSINANIREAILSGALSENQKAIFAHINTQIALKTQATLLHKDFNSLYNNTALYETLYNKQFTTVSNAKVITSTSSFISEDALVKTLQERFHETNRFKDYVNTTFQGDSSNAPVPYDPSTPSIMTPQIMLDFFMEDIKNSSEDNLAITAVNSVFKLIPSNVWANTDSEMYDTNSRLEQYATKFLDPEKDYTATEIANWILFRTALNTCNVIHILHTSDTNQMKQIFENNYNAMIAEYT